MHFMLERVSDGTISFVFLSDAAVPFKSARQVFALWNVPEQSELHSCTSRFQPSHSGHSILLHLSAFTLPLTCQYRTPTRSSVFVLVCVQIRNSLFRILNTSYIKSLGRPLSTQNTPFFRNINHNILSLLTQLQRT